MTARPLKKGAILFGIKAGDHWGQRLLLAGAILLAMLAVYGILWAAPRIEKVLPSAVLTVVTRVFGLLLAGIAVQLTVEGLGQVFPAWLADSSAIRSEVDKTRRAVNANGESE